MHLIMKFEARRFIYFCEILSCTRFMERPSQTGIHVRPFIWSGFRRYFLVAFVNKCLLSLIHLYFLQACDYYDLN